MTKKRSSRQGPGWPTKAYKNLGFLTAPEGRIVRVLSEFMEPAARFGKRHIYNTIVFFGSARTPPPEEAKKNLKELEKQVAHTRRPPRSLLKQYETAKRDLAFLKRVKSSLKSTNA